MPCLYAVCAQANIPVATFAAGVVATHVVFALLEKKRLENWEEKGEVGYAGPPWQCQQTCAACPVSERMAQRYEGQCAWAERCSACKQSCMPSSKASLLLVQAGHFGLAPFDPVGLTTDYNRQAEVCLWIGACNHLPEGLGEAMQQGQQPLLRERGTPTREEKAYHQPQ